MNETLDTEPRLRELLLARRERKKQPAYTPQSEAGMAACMERFFAKNAPGSVVSSVVRMGGGASKEQFAFSLTQPGGEPQRYVLRMDPFVGITETDRLREFELLSLFYGKIPVPRAAWVDPDGSIFPQPALIMEMVPGVTKGRNSGDKVSGLGTLLGSPLRERLRDQFFDILEVIHGTDWRTAQLPSFGVPDGDPKQAIRWCFNYWNELLEANSVVREPVVRVATEWLHDNMPDADELVIVHGDYRTGNYLFDEDAGRITAVLDWELAYIGDYHDELGWIVNPVFGTRVDGVFRAVDLFERDEFLDLYAMRTGRRVDPVKLHYYEVFNTWKVYIVAGALGMHTARTHHNHQDVLLTFLGAAAALFVGELARLLSERQAA